MECLQNFFYLKYDKYPATKHTAFFSKFPDLVKMLDLLEVGLVASVLFCGFDCIRDGE